MIRPERQAVVGKAQSSPDRRVPTVRPGDLGAIDVLDGGLEGAGSRRWRGIARRR